MISNFLSGTFTFVSAPKNGPDNEHLNISDITHESAVVSWLPIPVVEQQGFLQHYVIWISRQGNTSKPKVYSITNNLFAMLVTAVDIFLLV